MVVAGEYDGIYMAHDGQEWCRDMHAACCTLHSGTNWTEVAG